MAKVAFRFGCSKQSKYLERYLVLVQLEFMEYKMGCTNVFPFFRTMFSKRQPEKLSGEDLLTEGKRLKPV